MEKIKVLLFDEDRYGVLPTSFKADPEINDNCIVSFSTTIDTAFSEFKTRIFDVVVFTVDASGGIPFIRELKKIDPDCCIISFILEDNKEMMRELIDAGVYDIVTSVADTSRMFFLIRKSAELHKMLTSQRKLVQGLHEYNDSLQKQNLFLATRVEDSAKNLARLYENLRSTYLRTIKALAEAIDARDHYTHSHSQMVTKYGIGIAEELGLSVKDIELLREACELHDLGKIGIQDSILMKPGNLTEEEWQVMRRHPLTASQILESLTFLNGAIDMIRQHHEHYDGSGYPEGLSGKDIVLGARIIHLADAYDAMRSARSYRTVPLSKENALQEIRNNSGTQFDPSVVKAFLKIVDDLDPG